MNKGAFGFSFVMFNLKDGARRHSQCPAGIFVGATWFWAKASYQICMDLDGSATSTVGGQRWSHIEPERFLHFENQDQRIANSWMRYAQWPWNSPHLKHTWRTLGEHNWTWKVLTSFPTGTSVAKTFGWTGLTVFLSTAPGQQFDHELNRCWSMIHRWSLFHNCLNDLNDLKLWRLHQSSSVFHQSFFAISKVTAVDPPRIDNAAGQVLQLTCDSAPNPQMPG